MALNDISRSGQDTHQLQQEQFNNAQIQDEINKLRASKHDLEIKLNQHGKYQEEQR